MKKGDYIRNKELGIIDLIEIDLFDVGKTRKPGDLFQIRQVCETTVHGGFCGSVGWKGIEELQKNYEIITYKKIMKITNLVKKILDADTRKLVKAGFINGELALTDDGVSELLGILFLEKKDELVKIADEKMKETE